MALLRKQMKLMATTVGRELSPFRIDPCIPASRALHNALRGSPQLKTSTACKSRGGIACRASTLADKATVTPLPSVKIDNTSDPFATVVKVEYGENLGELMDTIVALKNLGLNIRRAKLVEKAGRAPRNVFYITDVATSEKITRSSRLEEIRMIIIHSLVASYPESASSLTSTASQDEERPVGYVRKVVATTVEVEEAENGTCSVLTIKTPDRPGLLVDIVKVLKDINLNVVSAEIDTIGKQAEDRFFVTYHGEPLTNSMIQLVTNSLQYYLSLSEVAKEESY